MANGRLLYELKRWNVLIFWDSFTNTLITAIYIAPIEELSCAATHYWKLLHYASRSAMADRIVPLLLEEHLIAAPELKDAIINYQVRLAR